MERRMKGAGEEVINEETNRHRHGGRESVRETEPEGVRDGES